MERERERERDYINLWVTTLYPSRHVSNLGQQVFWHSSAHILGEAMERHYGGCLCYGPPIDGGYYYDMYLEDQQVAPSDFGNLETLFKSIVKEKQSFVRLEMKKEDLLEMFKVCVCVCVCSGHVIVV